MTAGRNIEFPKAPPKEGRSLSDTVDRQWRLTTEAIKRKLIAGGPVCDAARKFCTIPVSEDLASKFISEISAVDPAVSELVYRRGQQLLEDIGKEPIPDEKLAPDLSNTPFLTREQKMDLARRFRCARDVKVLALGAELLAEPAKVSEGSNEVVLENGVRIVGDVHGAAGSDLLQPILWERRKQLKDRVYEIAVGGHQYILKEKKTYRHTDTKRHGHVPGHTSENEYKVAKNFSELGTVAAGDISVRWERPIGFVDYPDGYQFALFHHEGDLIPSDPSEGVNGQLQEMIRDNPEQYKEEFDSVLKGVKDALSVTDGDSNAQVRTKSGQLRGLFAKLGRLRRNSVGESGELTFDEFVRAKAHTMGEAAKELMRDIVLDQGFTNSDLDGYAFKIVDDNGKKLQLIAFDFEYYQKGTDDYIEGVKVREAESREREIHERPLEFAYFHGFGMPNLREKEAYKLIAGSYDALGKRDVKVKV